MLSQRRSAQLGLFAASLILVASVVVLIVGAADSQPQAGTGSQAIAPLADSQLSGLNIAVNKP